MCSDAFIDIIKNNDKRLAMQDFKSFGPVNMYIQLKVKSYRLRALSIVYTTSYVVPRTERSQ